LITRSLVGAGHACDSGISGDTVVVGLICGRMHGILVQVLRTLVGAQLLRDWTISWPKSLSFAFVGPDLSGKLFAFKSG